MADYVVTPENVVASDKVVPIDGTAGVTVTPGQPCCWDSADGRYKLFDANGVGDFTILRGIALHGASNGQPIRLAVEDPDFTPGFALAAGEVVIGSRVAGRLCPDADAVSGDFKTFVGIGKGSNKMVLKLVAAGAAKP